jgi:hypothetical protein
MLKAQGGGSKLLRRARAAWCRMSARVELTLAMLRRQTIELGLEISADDRVGEANAARLLKFHGDPLRRMRGEGTGPVHCRVGVGGSKISYRLIDLATWIERRRELSTT